MMLYSSSNAARFLWKRVPADIKTVSGNTRENCCGAEEYSLLCSQPLLLAISFLQSDELSALWSIGQALWKHEPVNNLLGAYPWSPLTQSLVLELAGEISVKRKELISLLL